MACRLGAQQGGLFPPPSYASAKPGTRNTERLALRAFTLVEMLAAVALLGMIASLLFFSLDQVSRATANGIGKATTYQDLRTAVDQMSRELQQAIPFVAVSGSDTNSIFLGKTAVPQGTTGNKSEVHFVATIDNNTGYEEVEVHYYYDGTNALWKAFGYYDGTNASTVWDFQNGVNFNNSASGINVSSWALTPAYPNAPLDPDSSYAPVLSGVKACSFEFSSSTNTALFVDTWLDHKQAIPGFVRVTLVTFDASVLRRWGSADKVPNALTNQARTTQFLVQLPRQNE
jgi:prepilin-type N-terminal cleavage/methylation domain-containing protein